MLPESLNSHVVRFIDNGVDRTEEAYKINNIEIDPEQENGDTPMPPLRLPLIHLSQSSDGSGTDNGNEELANSIQSSLWEAVYLKSDVNYE